MKTIKTDFRRIKADVITADELQSWQSWAAGDPKKCYHLGQGYDVTRSSDLYEVYEVDPDDDSPLGGNSGYLAVPVDDQG